MGGYCLWGGGGDIVHGGILSMGDIVHGGILSDIL